jgi:hypothetical protein
MQNISLLQKLLIRRVKKYLDQAKKNNINTLTSSSFYYNTYGYSLGYFKLKRLNLNQLIKKYTYVINDIFSLFINHLYIVKKNESYLAKASYNSLIVTWAKKEDFNNYGIFKDRYLGITCKNKKILWFVIYLDLEAPFKISNNVILLSNKKKINFLYIVKYFFIFLKNEINIYNFFYYFSSHSYLAYSFLEKIKNNVNLNKIKKLLIPYEAQPFQNLLANYIKKKNCNTKIIGYDHSIDAFPINNIYKKELFDIFYLHSKSQYLFYHKYLDWPKKKLILTNSFRFKKKKINFFLNKIYLPYTINDEDFIIKKLILLFNLISFNKLYNLKIKLHPFRVNSINYQIFKKRLVTLLKNYKVNNIKNYKKKIKIDNISIFIGATGSVLEALENGAKNIFHIVEDPILDSYSSIFWNKINIKKIDDNIFRYSLKNRNYCLKLMKKKNLNNLFLKFK